MFGLGAMEIVVILLLALIVLGPEKLPEVARKLARFTGELRRVSDEVRRNFDEASRDLPDLKQPVITPPSFKPPSASIATDAILAAAAANKKAEDPAAVGATASVAAAKPVDPAGNCDDHKSSDSSTHNG